MRVLALAGVAALALTMPITIAIVVVLAIVVLSYLQVIRAYPNGGGSYVVASQNLGVLPGLVAGSALLVDYFLTVAVSVAAGVAAVTSAFPDLHGERVLIAVVLVAFLTVGNLRGIREAGLLFAAPTYLYVFSVFGLIGIGLWRVLSGTIPAPVAAHRVGPGRGHAGADAAPPPARVLFRVGGAHRDRGRGQRRARLQGAIGPQRQHRAGGDGIALRHAVRRDQLSRRPRSGSHLMRARPRRS